MISIMSIDPAMFFSETLWILDPAHIFVERSGGGIIDPVMLFVMESRGSKYCVKVRRESRRIIDPFLGSTDMCAISVDVKASLFEQV